MQPQHYGGGRYLTCWQPWPPTKMSYGAARPENPVWGHCNPKRQTRGKHMIWMQVCKPTKIFQGNNKRRMPCSWEWSQFQWTSWGEISGLNTLWAQGSPRNSTDTTPCPGKAEWNPASNWMEDKHGSTTTVGHTQQTQETLLRYQILVKRRHCAIGYFRPSSS